MFEGSLVNWFCAVEDGVYAQEVAPYPLIEFEGAFMQWQSPAKTIYLTAAGKVIEPYGKLHCPNGAF